MQLMMTVYSLGQTLNHTTRDVYSPKAVETLIYTIMDNIMDTVFFIICV